MSNICSLVYRVFVSTSPLLEIQRRVLRICEEGGDVGSWRPTLTWILWVEAADCRPVTKGEVARDWAWETDSDGVGAM